MPDMSETEYYPYCGFRIAEACSSKVIVTTLIPKRLYAALT